MKYSIHISQLEESMFGTGGQGICLACGIDVECGCEPDAENYPCESCGERRVYGIEQAVLCGYIDVEGG